ncbi:MAG: hypothetical protein ACRDU0_07820 [Mycobacterium sp.]
MKALGVALFALVVAVVAVITYPQWYRPLTHVLPGVTRFLPTPSQAPVSPSPARTPAAVALPSPPPIVLITANPSDAPVGAGSLPDWTPADCVWAEQTVSWDHSLDAAEAQKIADRQDTRFGTGPALVQYYLDYAADWETALEQIIEVCGGAGVPSSAAIDATLQHFATAIESHQLDAASRAPRSTFRRLWDDVAGFFEFGDGWAIEWDHHWIGYYQRLEAMFSVLTQYERSAVDQIANSALAHAEHRCRCLRLTGYGYGNLNATKLASAVERGTDEHAQ